jgi:iron complex outermembrane receptor protein
MAKVLASLLRFGLAVLLVVPAGYARAGDADGKAEAKAHFTAGENHYNLNEFTEALQEFKDAYRLYPDPVFLYNLGQCERQLGHQEEAIRFYRSFLRLQPKAPNKAEVQRKIDEMEAAQKNKPVAEPDPAASPAKVEPATPAVVPDEPAGAPSPSTANAASEPVAVPPTPTTPTIPTPEPASSVEPAQLPPGVANITEPAAPAAESRPFYGTWWFWTATGVVAAGAVTAVLLSRSSTTSTPPDTTLGGKKVF